MRGDTPDKFDFSDETLFGYLLGGLPDEEMLRVQVALTQSPVLRQRLADLQGLLDPLEVSLEPVEPPADLTARTMARIAQDEEAGTRGSEFSEDSRLDWSEVPTSTRIAWMDSIVAMAAGIIFLSFLLPTVWQWRETARQFACAENLRNVGFGLLSYVNFSPSHQIPPIDMQGPRAFAGMYAIHLKDRELIDSTQWIYCPSNRVISTLSSIPTSEQFLAASPPQQQALRYLVGGNYAYHLGVLVDGKYRTPQLESPVRFAVLGDMWPSTYGIVESNVQPPKLHGDMAANMLFNDASVRLIRIPSPKESDLSSDSAVDNPYLNNRMQQGVGLGVQDACIAPSHWRPDLDIDLHR
jgi:hypothetical protein